MVLLTLILLPLLAAALSLFQRRAEIIGRLAIGLAAVQLVVGVWIVLRVASGEAIAFQPFLATDSLSALLMLITVVIGFIATVYSVGYLKEEVGKSIITVERMREYYALLYLFMCAMCLAVLTTNPMIMWIAVEATTLSTAFLINFYRKPTTLEAAWKYLIINSIGLLFALLGTLLFIASAAHLTQGQAIGWQNLIALGDKLDPTVVKIAFVLVFIGYGTKVGLVPMHTWKPDTYSKAPAPVVALFSGVLLNVALLAILRFKVVVDAAITPVFSQQLFIAFGVITIVVAAFIMFEQTNYKRLLAYSSIEHAGIMLLGFGLGGVATVFALLHMIYHALAKSLLFFAVGNVFLKYSSTKIDNIQGLLRLATHTSTALFIGFFAVTGAPPFGLFFTELGILSVTVVSHPYLTVLVVLALVIAFMGYFKQISAMVFGEPPTEVVEQTPTIGRLTRYPLFATILLLVGVSLYVPRFLQILIESAAISLN